MLVEQNGKRLWHVQSSPSYSFESQDLFILSKEPPTREQIEDLWRAEIGEPSGGEDVNEDHVKDFMDNHDMWVIYAEEL